MPENLIQPPKDKWAKRVRVLLMIALALALLTVLSHAVIPLALSNPHTRSGYQGWWEVDVPGLGTVMLPEKWQMAILPAAEAFETVGRVPVRITDETGGQVAAGYLFTAGMTRSSLNAAAADYAGVPLSEYRLIGGLNAVTGGRGGAFQECIFFSENVKVLQAWCLELVKGHASLVLWFPSDENMAAGVLFDQAKAMIYSVIY